ncbi:asparaginase [Fibrobacter succinogenes]|uniref:asparaginase n=1 Tax=Fibrobacter succinogenes TaxID=833 RepID=UPI001566CD04|nr:asparaginase [Fibrobacter succinogenes]
MAKKRIVVLTTGGTIAGVGESGKDTGYVSGQVPGRDLVASVPELAEYAEVSVEEVCNINSDDITDRIWIALANRVKELQEDESVDGIVITHGTDTMDETAYFLSLAVKCEKPVIFTGSMKPSTAKNPDGPANLLGAVRVAAGFAVDDDPPANSVWVYFAGSLFDARNVQKCSASALDAMGVDAAGDGSDLNAPREKNFFDVSKLESLPRVNVVYFSVDANPKVLEYAACVSDGLVIAGAGSGEFSKAWAEKLEAIDIPVVIASRTNHGVVTLNETLASGRICAGTLAPQKAAVLLRLCLTVSENPRVIKKFFANA